MDLYTERLVTLRQEAAGRLREMFTNAEAEKRELTAEENANLEALQADYDKYAAEEKRVIDLKNKLGPASDRLHEAIAPALDASRKGITDTDTRSFVGRMLAAEGMFGEEEARRVNLRADLVDGHRGYSAPISDYGKRAFYGPPMARPYFSAGASELPEYRALTVASGTNVAQAFADFVVVYERTLNPIYDVATVLPTSNGEIFTIPRLTADVAGHGTVVAEAGGVSEVDPTISAVNLGAFKFGSTTLWSNELAQDNYINLDQLVAESTARDLDISIGSLFTTGTGTVQPQGYVGVASNLGTALGTANGNSTDTFFSAADLLSAFYNLAAPYRRNATWLVATSALKLMRTFRDKNGQLLWSANTQAGAPDTFNNRPVLENPGLAAAASISKSVTVGDFSKYYIREVTPMRVDTSIHYKFSTDQFAIRTLVRRDGNLIDTAAVGYVINANS